MDCDYFHGKIDRSTVTRLLKIDGDFIVREKSDQSGDNVLSVMWRTQTKHFILKKDNVIFYYSSLIEISHGIK